MSVRIDRGDRDRVVWCTDCRGWSEITVTETAARRVALEHARSAHPDDRDARNAVDQINKRDRQALAIS